MIERGCMVYSSRTRPLFATLNRCKKLINIYGVAKVEFVRLAGWKHGWKTWTSLRVIRSLHANCRPLQFLSACQAYIASEVIYRIGFIIELLIHSYKKWVLLRAIVGVCAPYILTLQRYLRFMKSLCPRILPIAPSWWDSVSINVFISDPYNPQKPNDDRRQILTGHGTLDADPRQLLW